MTLSFPVRRTRSGPATKMQPDRSRVTKYITRPSIHGAAGCFTIRSRVVSKPRDWMIKLSHRTEIRQPHPLLHRLWERQENSKSMWYWFIFRLNTCIGAPILTWPTVAYSMYDTREELVSDNNFIVMTFCRYGRKYIAINIAYDDIISWNALCVEFLDHSWFSSASKQWPQSLESNTDVGNLYIYFASASLSSLFIYMNIYIYILVF